MWALAALYGNAIAQRWCNEKGIKEPEARDQSIATAVAGGNLVPTILSDSVIQLITEYGVARPNVKVQPMPGPYLEIPRRTGGLRAYAMGEAQSTTGSTKNWDKVILTARKWGCEVRLSNEVLADAVIDLASDITEEMARAFAFAEDDSTFNGDGGASYQSITGIIPKLTATVTTGTGGSAVTTGMKGLYTSAAATSFETISIADFTYLLASLPLFARQSAKWYISPVGWAASMQRLGLTSGSGTGLAGGNAQSDAENALGLRWMGYPVVLTNALDGTLGTDNSKVKVVFGDLSQGVVLGDLRTITYRKSTERLFELDQTIMLGTARFDINVHGVGDNTRVSGAQAGPIVALRTKAA
jgi:HK97 family phage major capsid protein